MPSGVDTEHFAGKPIELFRIEQGIVDPASFAYNIRYLKEAPSWYKRWFAFINDPRVSEVSALVIGGDQKQESWIEEIESLVSGREKLSALKSLFLEGNDRFCYDDGELFFSFSDVSPIFLAFPQLEELRLYGWTHMGVEFQIGTIHSDVLRSLSIATVWLEPRILHDLWRAHLPALEHLELWLCSTDQDNPPTIDDLAPLFSGNLFPHLRHLTLCQSQIEDDLAVALAASPLLGRLKVLDLSLGIFTDRGAQALLASPALRKLEKLVIRYHYCSDEMVQQLRALPLEVEIDAQQDVNETDDGEPEVMEWFHIYT